jgi:transporter family-2 protein
MLLLIPVIVGASITLQGAFSNKISQNVGFIEMVILIHFFGFIVSLGIYLVSGNPSFDFIRKINIYAVAAGVLGVIIVFGFAKSIGFNGVLQTILISVLVQMILSKIIDHFGFFGVTKVPINTMQVVSMLLMISAVVLFQKSQ